MSIPNTSSGWGLQDVVDDLSPATNDLAACFAVAIKGCFDPLYKGDRNSLLNFRNYSTPFIVLDQLSLDFAGNGSACTTAVINISTNLEWAASSNETFVTVFPTAGNGNGSITITCASNPTASIRTAIITVTEYYFNEVSDTCNISQAKNGEACPDV